MKTTKISRLATIVGVNFLGVFICKVGLGQGLEETADNAPNIVLIMADDLGYGDLGCFGCADIHSPNIDKLAEAGVRLNNFYAAAPVCSPTRCALMTGRYQQRIPNMEWVVSPNLPGLPQSEITIAEELKNAGYRTGIIGKWHLGAEEQANPIHHGFDYFFGFLGGNIDYFDHCRANKSPDLYRNTKAIKEKGYMTELVGEESVRFIKENARGPFFLYVAFNAPHWPFQGPDDEARDMSVANWHIGTRSDNYTKMVESMDTAVGRIMTTLSELNIEKNTLVIFTSDNGGDFLSNNRPFSGIKQQLKEGGIRVPCIFKWPGKLPEGTLCKAPGITMDITATVKVAAQLKSTQESDGVDLMPFLTKNQQPNIRTLFWRNNAYHEKAARYQNWKWYEKDGCDHLYNLDTDAGESNDLSELYSGFMKRIKKSYDLWEKDVKYNQTEFGKD